MNLFLSIHGILAEMGSQEVTLKSSVYSDVSKHFKTIGKDGSTLEVMAALEILETSLIMIAADLNRIDLLEKKLKDRFKRYNEDDVTIYLQSQGKLEALALIYEIAGNIPDALDAWSSVETDLSYDKTHELLMKYQKDRRMFEKYAMRCINRNP